jgi:mRNA interferase RelE/StbE
MVWRIEIEQSAEKELSRLGSVPAKRILSFLFDRLAHLDNARSVGSALAGSKFGELWQYRVGDYRLIAQFEDRKVQILIVRIGHRRDIYR